MELDITMISSILTISLGLDELQSITSRIKSISGLGTQVKSVLSGMTFSNAAATSVNLSGLKVDLSSGLKIFLWCCYKSSTFFPSVTKVLTSYL